MSRSVPPMVRANKTGAQGCEVKNVFPATSECCTLRPPSSTSALGDRGRVPCTCEVGAWNLPQVTWNNPMSRPHPQLAVNLEGYNIRDPAAYPAVSAWLDAMESPQGSRMRTSGLESILLHIYLSIYLPTCLSICLSMYLPIHLSTYHLSGHLSLSLTYMCISICLSTTYLNVHARMYV